jgi:hypothetical protein
MRAADEKLILSHDQNNNGNMTLQFSVLNLVRNLFSTNDGLIQLPLFCNTYSSPQAKHATTNLVAHDIWFVV